MTPAVIGDPPRSPTARDDWRARLDGLLELVSPRTCIECRAELGRRVDSTLAGHAFDALLCTACEHALGVAPPSAAARRIGRVPWPVHAPLSYRGPGEAWIRRIKYPQPGLAGLDADATAMLRALARATAAALPPVDAIVPVPLHGSAYLRRELNPALRWALALSRSSGAPVLARALQKRRSTRPQKGLGVAARRANVRDAFSVPKPHAVALRRAGRVLLVDDVVTTGATLEACARALHESGRDGEGVVACIARTPSDLEVG